MSRNANDANAAIFERLIGYAADRGVAISAGERRILLNESEYDVLVTSKPAAHLSLGRHQAAALLQTPSGELLALAGFAADAIDSTNLRESEVSPGIAVALLHDLKVSPTAGPATILNVVGSGSKSDPSYPGHDLRLVQELFPRLRVLDVDPTVAGESRFAANLLTVCAVESAEGNGWINEGLAKEIVCLGEQRIPGFPYEFLVRAVLDLDPTNLFLALYRCLEATYAFTRASELATKLGLADKSWIDVAKALGESLNWYPRHDQSLAALLSLSPVNSADIDALAAALGKVQGGDEAASRVATGVRELRNSLVHFGPTTRHAAVPNDDWNEVCIALSKVVGSVFSHAYGDLLADKATSTTASSIPSPPPAGTGPRRRPLIDRVIASLVRWRGEDSA